ncbi:MAG: hypothetical protein ACM31O_14015 [Bacteroidota bacterium]
MPTYLAQVIIAVDAPSKAAADDAVHTLLNDCQKEGEIHNWGWQRDPTNDKAKCLLLPHGLVKKVPYCEQYEQAYRAHYRCATNLGATHGTPRQAPPAPPKAALAPPKTAVSYSSNFLIAIDNDDSMRVLGHFGYSPKLDEVEAMKAGAGKRYPVYALTTVGNLSKE